MRPMSLFDFGDDVLKWKVCRWTDREAGIPASTSRVRILMQSCEDRDEVFGSTTRRIMCHQY
jgi:hypothetical protein